MCRFFALIYSVKGKWEEESIDLLERLWLIGVDGPLMSSGA
jgi:hypothetical protein